MFLLGIVFTVARIPARVVYKVLAIVKVIVVNYFLFPKLISRLVVTIIISFANYFNIIIRGLLIRCFLPV